MANSDKNIKITPNTNTSNLPEIQFVGGNNDPVYLRVTDNLSFYHPSYGEFFKLQQSLPSSPPGGIDEFFSAGGQGGPALRVVSGNNLELNPGGTGTTFIGLSSLERSGTSTDALGNTAAEVRGKIPGGVGPTLDSGDVKGALIVSQDGTGIHLDIGINANESPQRAWLQCKHRSNGAQYNLALNPLGGNVGIGTSTPGNKLSVVGAGDGANLGLTSTGTNARSRINFNVEGQNGWQLECAAASGGGNQPAGALGFTQSGVSSRGYINTSGEFVWGGNVYSNGNRLIGGGHYSNGIVERYDYWRTIHVPSQYSGSSNENNAPLIAWIYETGHWNTVSCRVQVWSPYYASSGFKQYMIYGGGITEYTSWGGSPPSMTMSAIGASPYGTYAGQPVYKYGLYFSSPGSYRYMMCRITRLDVYQATNRGSEAGDAYAGGPEGFVYQTLSDENVQRGY
jgi:hypothetical protein